MKRIIGFFMMLAIASTSINVSESWARPGGGRSFGSRGSSGFSAPARPYGGSSNSFNRGGTYNSQRPGYPQSQPYNNNSQPSQPSMMRGLGTGIAGGFLGSMLYNGIRGGGGSGYGYGGGGGGGIGLLDILLLAGLAFVAFRIFRSRRERAYDVESSERNTLFRNSQAQEPTTSWQRNGWGQNSQNVISSGSSALRLAPLATLDTETASDLFFKIQGAFTQRDLQPVKNILTTEVYEYLNNEIEALKRAHRFNRLENIAIRNTEITESWTEGDRQYSTVWIKASLLDYAIDENTRQVVEGSATSPVTFEEYWTFVTSAQDGPQWRLSAIQQA